MSACLGCLDELVACNCGEMVRAGSGHDCERPWGGYWMCQCGHCTRHHNAWWDDGNGHDGMGCDRCDCPDCEPVETP